MILKLLQIVVIIKAKHLDKINEIIVVNKIIK